MRFFCALSSFLICLHLSAGERTISFNHLNLEDRMSSVPIYDIFPDSVGVMWLATPQGLECYDGNTVYRVSTNKSSDSRYVRKSTKQFALGEDGILYVLHGTGVYSMKLSTNEFEPVFLNPCNCIAYSDGLWMGIRNTLMYTEGVGSPVQTVYELSAGEGDISALLKSRNGDVWIGTTVGNIIVLRKTSGGGLARIDVDMVSKKSHSHIFRMYEDSNGTVWIGTLNDGAIAVSTDGCCTVYRHDLPGPGVISSNYVRAFCEDDFGNMWIGTYTGLDCIDAVTGNVKRYSSELMSLDTRSSPSVWAIVKDGQGTMWVGTYFGGINYFNPGYDIYNRYPISSIEGKGLSSPVISKLLADSSGRLWIATEGGGLNMLDRETGDICWYNTDSPKGKRLSENNVKDMIYVKPDNTIWIGLHLGGVNAVDVRTGKVRIYKSDSSRPDALPSDDVMNIADYGDSLIVRMKTSVCVMDKKTGRCRAIEPLSGELERIGDIRRFFVDNDHNIWLCRNSCNRLSKLSPPYIEERVYSSDNADKGLFSDEVLDMMQDASGKIWIASENKGLYMYSGHDDAFVSFGEQSLKLGGAEYMAESPSSGNIICSSEYGFLIFNPITHNVVRYGKEKGFPASNSKTRCIAVLPDSEIFIGGYGGLVSVNEKDLDIPRKPYRLFFTDMIVNGEKVEIGGGILEKSILNTSSVALPSNTTSIELYFSSSNHIAINETPVEYCLEGFDKTWKSVEGERKIAYTNLPSGKYRLLLRPSSGVPEDICPGIGLDIHILTPWYSAWWARLIYVLIVTSAVLLVVNSYTNKVRMRESLKHEKERAVDLENLNQAKLRFFTNISHEIRTPLTIIIAEIESIIQRHNFSPALYKKLLGVYKNSLSLRELISELMEFRKQEQGRLVIKAAPHNIVFFINEFYLLFSEYAASKGIKLSLTKDIERLEVWYDQIQMQKVLNNILSNSIKFTPEGGSINIRVYSTGTSAIVEIADTGCGIPEKDLKNIFDRFYQVEYSGDINTGTGIGLALAQGIVKLHSGTIDVKSTEGEGTVFSVMLPLGYSHFSQELLADTSHEVTKFDFADKISVPAGDSFLSDARDAQQPQKGHTIVVAEDNQGILEMLVELFAPFYNVVAANDGVSALEAVRKNLPSLVVSDVLMPRMNGTQLCKAIKNDPALCHIPVVLLTARVDVEQNMEGLQQGADDYITKPFNSTLLLSRCNNLVNSRIILQEKYSKNPGTSTWMLATNRLDNEFLKSVTDIVNRNLDNTSFEIGELIMEVGMSRTSFFRKLKAITGQTPTEFIQMIRIRKGAELLRNNPEMNISEISDAIGFNTAKYFAKCFKEHYGKSPLAWRKEITQNK